MSLLVLHPGIMSLPQDDGRRGLMHIGLTQGGPMDLHAWAWANHLLGNRFGASALEIVVGGTILEAETNLMLALTGADLDARIDDKPLSPWQSFALRKGQRLIFGHPRHGLRAYLAVTGGFLISGPTIPRERRGGLYGDGLPLSVGDRLPCHASPPLPGHGVPTRFRLNYRAALSLRLIPGAQFETFPPRSREALFRQEWTISSRSDRMGARLHGEAIEAPQGLVSEGVPYGAVQVPPDGQPIILLNDRQTLGGYPKLGAIHPLDLPGLVQRMPGAPLRLEPIGLGAAQAEMRCFLGFFRP